ncbi:CTB family bacteriocin [Acaryochloris marina]|uniref:CTB family bacteriocin n=1 Tax=Acaryochloris marina TaxID=155978 RepID=UPI001BAFB0D5|nr:CTB family bacteriocin [Acaryochloris marina]QUY46207.1 CTB family bacteriocin [Acaryochloris marina S15]
MSNLFVELSDNQQELVSGGFFGPELFSYNYLEQDFSTDIDVDDTYQTNAALSIGKNNSSGAAAKQDLTVLSFS